jgi:beta-lactamase class A
MGPMLTRRKIGLGLGATLAAGATVGRAAMVQKQVSPQLRELGRRFVEIEAWCGGRLGVGVIDTQSGRMIGHRGDERFPMCSTYKALSAAAILSRADRGKERMDRRIRFTADEVLPYSPATGAHAGSEGMTLSAICEGAVTLSDNTAADLMLSTIGGPAGLTSFLREIGDEVTRLDRTEPTLNEALPGDPRDTTTPFSMAVDLNRLVLGEALSPASRTQLSAWLVACKTGGARLRAGIPKDWRIGEKTGSGDRGTANDVGILWPPARKPVVVTAFITGSVATQDRCSAAIVDVARAIVNALDIEPS